ncbi:Histidine phosphatase family protein [Candidatus Nitrotoga sp. HW29]|uniref:histidine phosphatase family protein n=1 Tax=Candidatus Nitrotoga sp. HW29 TaxID=2886963 RepID=UPI001EF18015|nr:histidine phosphatase family protein [Candidatus Nitrotoga sp. HW29]CAH1905983.1 Histidine phosphatase family protein [Candidatus Nitrotoga sp. HW29]
MKINAQWIFRIFVFLALTSATAHAQIVDVKALAERLKQGGYVIVFRHGATNRDQADTDPLNYDNTAKQRLLSEDGKALAAQVGASFKALQIPIGQIYTSKFNRAIETGRLIGGTEAASSLDITEGGLIVTPIENDRRAEALRKMTATSPEHGKNTLLVTHKPNIIDAFGKDWFEVKEGEASIFQPDGAGKAVPIARVQAIEWIKAAK